MIPRSLLFVPGDRPERMEKAAISGADAIILDLEDAVSLTRKEFARDAIVRFLALHDARSVDVIVRINPLDTEECVKDLEVIRAGRVAAVMLPKSEGAASIIALLGMLRTPIPVLPIAAETPSSLFSLGSYVEVSQHLFGITWGAEDLATSVGATSSRTVEGCFRSPLETARNLTLFAAAAADTAAIETVYANVRDRDGLHAEAYRAAAEGFSGMMAIHPDQIRTINAAFSPTAAEFAEARQIIRLFEKHPESGVATLNGKMVDAPHHKRARAIIKRARRISERTNAAS
ncbi:MAG: CoA ester lyase [Sphingobium sp.]|nr:CoA ester lyase [Sphingomonas sp.]